ncbi:YkuS family protein [Saccharibacillus sacchari]|uniref:YkuS family protein n=1 Tax=Saccharibacillus sacchari TaxID=456493 RepID=UPI0004B6075B|nr:YkuS family protein [Saccharibacillus sacchari]
MAKIAVEQPFADVKEALEEKGYEVELFESDENISGFDLGVVRALNDGNTDQFDFPVISIEGLSINDVLARVEQSLSGA